MTGFYDPLELAGVAARARALRAVAAAYDPRRPPTPVLNYDVPGWYTDPAGFTKAVDGLTGDTAAAYLAAVQFALYGDADAHAHAMGILQAWANGNKAVSGHDGQLSMAELGSGLILADTLLGMDILADWIRAVYAPVCDAIKGDKNNWGAWGLFGKLLGGHHAGLDIAADVTLLGTHIDQAIAPDGTLPIEMLRGEGALWYTYYHLVPLCAAARLVRNLGGPDYFRTTPKVRAALTHLLTWVKSNPAGQSLPRPVDPWPNDLFEAMGAEYSDTTMTEYAARKRPLTYVTHHFAWAVPTLLHAHLLP
jgi:hypothetical protein